MADNLPQSAVDAILQARQAAAHAEQDAKMCVSTVQRLESINHSNTKAYMESLRRYQKNADAYVATGRIVKICTWVILACTAVNLAVNVMRLAQ